jgi:single-stranded-DNA-specific exonuclease
MALGVECLLCDDAPRAHGDGLAPRQAINAERKELQSDMTEGADALLGRAGAPRRRAADRLEPAGPGWHAGVVGLVASRLKDRLNRPVIAFAPADERGEETARLGALGAGLPRARCAGRAGRAAPGLILRFGGHAMAAGCRCAPIASPSSPRRSTPRRGRASARASTCRSSERRRARPDEFRVELAEQLAAHGPFGQAFPEPLFDGVFDVARWWPMKERHLRLGRARRRRRAAAARRALQRVQGQASARRAFGSRTTWRSTSGTARGGCSSSCAPRAGVAAAARRSWSGR